MEIQMTYQLVIHGKYKYFNVILFLFYLNKYIYIYHKKNFFFLKYQY